MGIDFSDLTRICADTRGAGVKGCVTCEALATPVINTAIIEDNDGTAFYKTRQLSDRLTDKKAKISAPRGFKTISNTSNNKYWRSKVLQGVCLLNLSELSQFIAINRFPADVDYRFCRDI